MATSYTSLLGLALPVTGELAGTWGDTVNNSITSLLDTAVAGTTTLSTDADVTLTTTTGASNQARQAILLCSGARTALRTITAPAQSKIYVVINSTTGGFGVKLVGAGPTTGVTVAAGKTAVLVWNGSDFVEVAPATATTATNLAGGAAGSVPYQTGSGATTFLSLGTAGQVLQVNAGATAPEWVSSTGTGNVVRATSPTIATPTFTTSATFPLHIGGTGTTSTLTLRSTSGVGTTGADIIFQTGNNGATEAMRILNSGNVGVGTASPAARLDVAGGDLQLKTNATYLRSVTTGGTSIRMLGINSSDIAYIGPIDAGPASVLHSVASSVTLQSFFTGGSERMRIDSSGNLGVGTTTPATAFHARAPITVTGLGNGGLLTLENSSGAAFDQRAEILFKNVGQITSAISSSYTNFAAGPQYAGDLVFATKNTTDAAIVERMRITSAGNVGVGTATPSELVDIVKAQDGVTRAIIRNTSAGTAAQAQYQLSNGTSLASFGHTGASFTTAGVFRQDGSYISAAGAGGLTLNTSVSQPIYFGTASTERMRIDSNGTLIVGTTTPLANTRVHISQNSDSNFSSAYSPGSNKQQLVLRDLSDTTTYPNCYTQVSFVAGATGAGASYIAGAREGAGTSFMAFGTGTSSGATERMRIDSSGRVLIGQTASRGTVVAKLQVDDSRISITSSANGIIGGLAPDSSVSNSLNIEADPDNVAASSRIVMSIDGGEKMRLTANGSLGIGTSSPLAQLDVSQSGGSTANALLTAVFGADEGTLTTRTNATVKNARIGAPHYTNAQSPMALFVADATSTDNGLSVGGGTGSMNAATYIRFFTAANNTTLNGTERMRITSAGDVGIGTASPSTKLHVYGGSSYTAYKQETTTGTSEAVFVNSAGSINVGVDGAAGYGYIGTFVNKELRVYTNSAERMRLDVNGKLLLGTTTRGLGGNADMTVANGTNTVYSSVTGSTVQAYVGVDASTGFIGNYTNHPLLFLTNNTERVRVDTAGNLGIGNAAPLNKLDVNGSLGRNAPVTKTGNFTLAATENWLICNGAGTITVTLPAASSWTGREVMIKTIAAQTVVSASSNVVPLAGGAAGTAILAATAGKFATLVSDGTNWIIMQAN